VFVQLVGLFDLTASACAIDGVSGNRYIIFIIHYLICWTLCT